MRSRKHALFVTLLEQHKCTNNEVGVRNTLKK